VEAKRWPEVTARPDDLVTVDDIDAFFAAALGVSVEELRASDEDK
jgi:hypothetical protein